MAEMAEIEAQLDILRQFNRKVERLERSGFCRRYENELPNVVARFEEVKFRKTGAATFEMLGRLNSVLEDFNQDEIDAFVLTYRIFTQSNDLLSIPSLARIYASAWMPRDATECFQGARDQLNEYLDGDATILFGERSISIRQLVDVVIYGGLAHTNPEKSRIFESWERSGVMGFIWAEFFAYARYSVRIVRYLRDLNVGLLAHVEQYGFVVVEHE